jgi:hypothetical protein
MASFGETLRSFRQASNDLDRLNRRLTQERLGELIGREMGDLGFSGAAISDWERGRSRINAADRTVLVALIQVLHKSNGLRTLVEANRFLESGNYRALDETEIQRIFGSQREELTPRPPLSRANKSITSDLLLAALFSISKEETDALLHSVQEGPNPIWPRILAAFLRRATDRFSFTVRTVLWVWVWLFAWWLISLSLRLPYANRDAAIRALGMYACGSILVPLLIGLLVNTKNNDYWKQQSQIQSSLLTLYTYQGAAIGFNLGYFLLFPIVLIRYYLHANPSILLEFFTAGLGLLLGNMAARVVPHNLWRAYGRLTLADGGIFFVVAFIGVFWSFFFFRYYSLFLIPLWGTSVILIAFTITGIMIARQAQKQL